MIHAVNTFVGCQESRGHFSGEVRYRTTGSSEETTIRIDQHSESIKILLGYRLPNLDGEYLQISIDPAARKVEAVTDFFGSFPGYVTCGKNFVTISSDLAAVVSDRHVCLDPTKLHQYLTIGFTAFDERTVYDSVEFLPKSSRFIADFSGPEVCWRVEPNKPEGAPESFHEALVSAYESRIEHMARLRIPILVFVTAGTDSGLVVSNLKNLRVSVNAATMGLANSDDVVVGRDRARRCGYAHRHVPLLDSDKVDLRRLLGQHSQLTGGMGPSSEIETLNFVQQCHEEHVKAFFVGHGGEFWRLSLKSEEYFSDRYLTPPSIISDYTEYEDLRPTVISQLFRFQDPVESLHRFYVDERYPRNVSRKTSIMSPYGLMVNPMVDIHLYRLARREFLNFSQADYMERFAVGRLNFPLRHESKNPYFCVNGFFRQIAEMVSQQIEDCRLLLEAGVKTRTVVRKIRSGDYTDREAWFFCRLAALAIFLNSRS